METYGLKRLIVTKHFCADQGRVNIVVVDLHCHLRQVKIFRPKECLVTIGEIQSFTGEMCEFYMIVLIDCTKNLIMTKKYEKINIPN